MIEALARIQKELNAPKGQRNNFGNYNYRSCEDILNALKSIMQNGEAVTLTDDLVIVGDRYYIKAIATFYHDKDSTSVSAYAREPINKKGMDESQITGAASSYARKYALNGLFAIDDTKDADTQAPQDNCSIENEKEWLDVDTNPQAWQACTKWFADGITHKDIVKRMRTKYKVSKKMAEIIETNLTNGANL